MPAQESQKAFDIDLPMPDYLLLKCSPKDSSNLISTRYSDSEITAIGKKHALNKYDQFALDTSCFWGSAGSNITPVVQFTKFLLQKKSLQRNLTKNLLQ